MTNQPSAVRAILLLFLVQIPAVSQVTKLYDEGPGCTFSDWELMNCSASAGVVRMDSEQDGSGFFVKKYVRREVIASGWVLLMHDYTGTTCMCTWPQVSVVHDASAVHRYLCQAIVLGSFPIPFGKQLTVIDIPQSPSYISYDGPIALHEAHNLLSVPSAYALGPSCVVDRQVYAQNVTRGTGVRSGYTIVYGPFRTSGTHLAVYLRRDEDFMWGFQYAVLNGDTVHSAGNQPGTAITFGGATDTSGFATVELCFGDDFQDFTTDEITIFDVDTSSTAIRLPSVTKATARAQPALREFYDLCGRRLCENAGRPMAHGTTIRHLPDGGTQQSVGNGLVVHGSPRF